MRREQSGGLPPLAATSPELSGLLSQLLQHLSQVQNANVLRLDPSVFEHGVPVLSSLPLTRSCVLTSWPPELYLFC